MAEPMTKARYAQYIAAFNDSDFPGFGKFYADDVVLELPVRTLKGRDAILDFYRVVKEKQKIRETLTVKECVIDGNVMAVDVETEFHATVDAPDFVVRPMKRGESIHSESFIFYTIRDGKFAHIRATRFKML